MRAIAYEGYFNNGQFYTSGKALRIPEQKRVVITILDDDSPIIDGGKITAWNDFKRIVKDTANENELLSDFSFNRTNGGRELVDFAEGANGL